MSDLDKLMAKLDNIKEAPAEKEVEVEDKAVTETKNVATEKEVIKEETTEKETFENVATEKEVIEEPKPTDEKVETENQENIVENEIAILQNNGIFRRELLILKKESIEIEKVKTQALISIAKSLENKHT